MAVESRIALIVGGGTGIGLATARRLGGRGLSLVLAGRRAETLAGAKSTLEGDMQERARIEIAPGDAGVEEDADRIVAHVLAAFGRLDVCVNAAGIYEPVDFLELRAESWRRTMSASLDSMIYIGAPAARAMVAGGRGGRFVLVSSINSPVSEPESAHYSAAKAGVSSIARSMAVDLSKHGIVANAIAPGWVRTAMVEDWLATASPESLARINLLGRVGTPEEVANVIEYLALDAPDYLTGSTVFVDGGQTAMAPLP
jgi:NAD(P)-dependent dehydrogenase (short-subunit alcohol dehydrogenase family)